MSRELRERIAELEAEIADLRAELGRISEAEFVFRFVLQVYPKMARVLARLYAVRGRWVTRDSLMAAINDDVEVSIKTLHVYIFWLRQRLGAGSIEGQGWRETYSYRLSPSAIAHLDSLIRAHDPDGLGRDR